MMTYRAVLRWGALVVSTAMVLLFAVMFVGEGISSGPGPLLALSIEEILEFAAVFVMIIGALTAWRWGRVGGMLMVAGGLLFIMFESAWSGEIRLVWFAVVFLAAGLGMLLTEVERERKAEQS